MATAVEAVTATSPRSFRGAHSPAYMRWMLRAKPAITSVCQGNFNSQRSGVLEWTSMGKAYRVRLQDNFSPRWAFRMTWSMFLVPWPCAFPKSFTKQVCSSGEICSSAGWSSTCVSYSHMESVAVASFNLKLYISVPIQDAMCLNLCFKPAS